MSYCGSIGTLMAGTGIQEILSIAFGGVLKMLTRKKYPQIVGAFRTYTKSTLNHIHHHYSHSVTPTHTTHTISSTAPTYAPHCHPWICGQTPLELLARWRDMLAGGPKAG